MGYSAKVTRGGNKKRVNQGRLESKMRAQGAKSHTTTAKESVDARRRLKQRSLAISDELKAKAAASTGPKPNHPGSSGAPIVRMAPRPSTAKKPATGAGAGQQSK